ncbi:MAG TPA: hypothetical protein VFM57_17890, partial [Thermoleophilaceae bacterium]|nr:hypothetical protein [Thermoleophilaceae bacterium]
ERLMHDVIKSFARDRGFFEAADDRCLTDPRLAELRARSLEAMGRLLKRAQQAGAVRNDISASDLSFLVGSAAHAMSAPLPDLRDDLWKRYLRIILDGMKPEGASKLRPGAPKLT